MKKETINIYTDGACFGNPGPGGWGVIISFNQKEVELSGGETDTTNNRMELTATIEALKQIKTPSDIVITTDSKYVLEGITKWMVNWKNNKWKTAAKKPVKNVDLWMKLDKLTTPHNIKWKWIKGHSGHPENERCDELAKAAIDELDLITI